MKILKYVLFAAIILFLGYHSVEIKPLDEVKKAAEQKFDAAAYAQTFLKETLPSAFANATPIQALVSALAVNKDQTFQEFSHAISIGNIRHFLVSGEGSVAKIDEDEVLLLVKGQEDSTLRIRLATEFIYGNSIRDAAGLFDLKQFTNNTDVNNVASEINKLIRTELIPPFKQQVKEGSLVQFIGAVEMNQEHPQLDDLEVLPISLKVLN